MNQTWTKTLPTVEGWYWVICEPDAQPAIMQVAVVRCPDNPLIACGAGVGESFPVDRDEFPEALWCGPLPVPAIPLEV